MFGAGVGNTVVVLVVLVCSVRTPQARFWNSCTYKSLECIKTTIAVALAPQPSLKAPKG